MHGDQERRDLYQLGVSVSMAFNAPKELKSLLNEPGRFVTNDDVSGMLRIPGRNKSRVSE
jgi:hypothetical protein